MRKGRKVDPSRLGGGDVCDVQVVLTMVDGSTKAGLAVGGCGDKITLVSTADGVRREEYVPVWDVMEARRS